MLDLYRGIARRNAEVLGVQLDIPLPGGAAKPFHMRGAEESVDPVVELALSPESDHGAARGGSCQLHTSAPQGGHLRKCGGGPRDMAGHSEHRSRRHLTAS